MSYGKKYKNHLFSNKSFAYYFKKWFFSHGKAELSKKYNEKSDVWFVLYDYGCRELINFLRLRSESANDKNSTDFYFENRKKIKKDHRQ